MNETLITAKGAIFSVTITPTTITFEKREQFDQGITDPTMVMHGDHPTPLASYYREWMYQKIDVWVEMENSNE